MARLSAGERRAQLIDAAISVMAREGVAKATTRAIVAEAGLPLGVFHYCFRSKEELFGQVIEAITSRGVAAAMGEVVGRHHTVRDIIRASARAYWAEITRSPGERQVSYELTQYALRQPGLADVARRQYEHYLRQNIGFLTAVADSAGVEWTTPVPALARYLLGLIDGTTLIWLADRDREKAIAVFDEFAEYAQTLSRQFASETSL